MEQHPIPMTAEALVGLFELFGIEPVLAFRLSGLQVSTLAGVLLGAAVLAALPPAWRAARGRPADALSDA
jgi:ABC-type lipoprotein release transport system permease subunit